MSMSTFEEAEQGTISDKTLITACIPRKHEMGKKPKGAWQDTPENQSLPEVESTPFRHVCPLQLLDPPRVRVTHTPLIVAPHF